MRKIYTTLLLLLVITSTQLAQKQNLTLYDFSFIEHYTCISDKALYPYGGEISRNVYGRKILVFDLDVVFFDVDFILIADFWGARFYSSANFSNAKFPNADFSNAKFFSNVDFSYAQFDSVAEFKNTEFVSVSFCNAEFLFTAEFSSAKFSSIADFFCCKFKKNAIFDDCNFGTLLNFEQANFIESIDFRRTKFDSVKTLYLYRMTYPKGKLLFYWDQFKGDYDLKIKLSNEILPKNLSATDSTKEHYRRIETIYHGLRDNFLAQGNKESADAVMYELGWQKEEIIGSFWQKLYGWLFGYGYKAWRFVVLLIIPIVVLFAFVWWHFYEPYVFNMVGKNGENGTTNKTSLRKTKALNVPLIYKVWHVLYFSASVLLGIRWKQEWSCVPEKTPLYKNYFLWVVTFQYLLGLGLYITFAVLIKSNQFQFIKGLFGF